MNYRILGKTGLRVSEVGVGGIPIQRADGQTAKVLMAAAADMGVNFLDSARAYSVSEQFLGDALVGIRDRFIIATKSGAKTKADMARDVEISLKNFHTDHIDLYQFHNPNPAGLEQIMAPGGALEALLEAKAAGKIGHIGITLHSKELFEKALELSWVETIMFPYNIVETQAEELIAACKEKNIGFICMKPMAGGALDDGRIAMRFLAQNENIGIIIPGMASVAELEQNVAAYADKSPLTEAEEEKIAAIRQELGNDFCRRCNYCSPCTVGINIYSVLLFEGYYTRYNLKDWASDRYNALDKYASECIGCGVCETRCPYGLPIRQKLKKAAEIFGK